MAHDAQHFLFIHERSSDVFSSISVIVIDDRADNLISIQAAVVIIILCFLLVGFILIPFFLLLGLLAPIFGAIAASKGQSFRYPLTIRFF